MPELPEVETVARGLRPAMVGSGLVRVEVRRPDLRFPFPEDFAERLTGQTVCALDRRAKYLVARLSGGDDLVMHLGMTGRFTIAARGCAPASQPGAYVYAAGADPKHDHVVLHLGNGATITYNDPRRFGYMLLIPATTRADHPLFKGLGVEPLGPDLSAAYLSRRAAGRKANLKAFLLDQRIIAGLGNIYVSEALHRARLSPDRSAGSLAERSAFAAGRRRALVAAIREVLEAAVRAGGSTLRDYRQANGETGAFQEAFRVYDREGEPCPRRGCQGTIRRTVHAARATFYCPKCQR